MGLLKKIIKLVQTLLYNDKSNFIFYRIVNFVEHDNKYIIQCCNTDSLFFCSLEELISDLDILLGLSPIQSCYIGVKYAHILRKTDSSFNKINKHRNTKYYFTHRYGKYTICYENRKNQIVFMDSTLNNEYIMDPRDLALSHELIQEFDSGQSFYIGLLAGLKLNSPFLKNNSKKYNNIIHLNFNK